MKEPDQSWSGSTYYVTTRLESPNILFRNIFKNMELSLTLASHHSHLIPRL
ncbi:hypothetical protein EMIT079MI2_70139 [Bacillus sp. IT-79MI2]